MTETKEQKFVRMAAARSDVILKKIALMGNLVNSDYNSTEEQRREIIANYQHAIDTLARAWKVSIPPAEQELAPTAVALTKEPDHLADELVPNSVRAVVEGVDRKDIREALRLLTMGSVDLAAKKLRSVVCGWAPEGWETSA